MSIREKIDWTLWLMVVCIMFLVAVGVYGTLEGLW